MPVRAGETHLAAALIGVLLAITLRRLDLPPRTRYSWEDERDEYEDGPSAYSDTRQES